MSGRLLLCVAVMLAGCGDVSEVGSQEAAEKEPCAVKCMAGYHQPANGACTCIPDGPVACGDKICPQGKVCCNPSCGICTAPLEGCIQLFCEPRPHGKPCGTAVCGAGEFCCNASCSICAPRGGFCTQQVCAALP